MKLLILIGIANGTPILMQRILGTRFAFPIDGGRRLADGQALFGSSKSVRGIGVAILAAAAGASLLGFGWVIGILVGAMAMVGDLISSFTKRRMKLPPSSMALGLDQVPESLLPAMACACLLKLTASDIVMVVAAFFALELMLSRFLFWLHLRERPY